MDLSCAPIFRNVVIALVAIVVIQSPLASTACAVLPLRNSDSHTRQICSMFKNSQDLTFATAFHVADPCSLYATSVLEFVVIFIVNFVKCVASFIAIGATEIMIVIQISFL